MSDRLLRERASSASGEARTYPPVAALTTTVEDAARRIGVGRTLAYQQARAGTLPGVRRIGRRLVVSLPELEAWLLGNRG
jgi:excisionase family DNA binding protein